MVLNTAEMEEWYNTEENELLPPIFLKQEKLGDTRFKIFSLTLFPSKGVGFLQWRIFGIEEPCKPPSTEEYNSDTLS